MSKKLDEYTKEELLAYVRQLQKDTKFGLVWNPKQEHIVDECETKVPVLQEVPDRAITKADDSEPTHLLLEGDNYHSLSVLNYTHASKIDIIYIDPPYNTGNKDFIYNDHYVDKEDPYRHSEWLSFMDNRLRLAKGLLSDKGIIYISINDIEQAHLRILCDKIFGEANLLANIVWQNKEGGGSSDSSYFRVKHEYILVYAKDISNVEIEGDPISNRDRYKQTDEYEAVRGPYYLQKLGMGSIQYSASLDYPITMSDGTVVYPKDNNSGMKACWRWSRQKYDWGVTNGFVEHKKDKSGQWQVYTKQYLLVDSHGEAVDRSQRPFGVIDAFSSTQGAKTLRQMGIDGFSYPKPVELIKYLISKSSTNHDSVILDFFAGSGTTGHAVLEMNKEDGGKRQFILGTDSGKADEGGVNIAENITFQRIKKVMDGYGNTAGIPANLRYYKTDFVEVEGINKLTDNDKLEITKEMGAMIALRENSFEQVEQTSHWQTYENNTQITAIYYREDKTKIDEYIDKLNAQDKPVKLYVFGWGKNAGTEYASKKISVEDIPEPLIEVYKEIAK